MLIWAEHFELLIAQENFQLPQAIRQGICRSLTTNFTNLAEFNLVIHFILFLFRWRWNQEIWQKMTLVLFALLIIHTLQDSPQLEWPFLSPQLWTDI